ncbi:MAG: ComF family protein [Christensenellales bacterium]|jgi:competence protein ComFC
MRWNSKRKRLNKLLLTEVAAPLFPKSSRLLNCCLCGLPAIANRGLCPDCEQKLPNKPEARIIPGIRRAEAAFLHEEPALSLIHRFKYEYCRYLAEFFALFMAELDDFPKDAVLVPVPLHPKRQKLRGFSQTVELCRELATLTGRRVNDGLLTRIRDTAPQTGLSFAGRQTNLAGAFSAGDAKGVSAILVDDVITSGATLKECAKALKDGGAAAVFALCASSAQKSGR